MVIPSIAIKMNSDGRVMYGLRMVLHLDRGLEGPGRERERDYVLVDVVCASQVCAEVGFRKVLPAHDVSAGYE